MESWLGLQAGREVENSQQLRDGVLLALALANILPERFHNLRYFYTAGS
jgi:hypothetical protein